MPKKLDDETLKDLLTLKRALEIAENKSKALLRVSVDEFNRTNSKIGGGICVEHITENATEFGLSRLKSRNDLSTSFSI